MDIQLKSILEKTIANIKATRKIAVDAAVKVSYDKNVAPQLVKLNNERDAKIKEIEERAAADKQALNQDYEQLKLQIKNEDMSAVECTVGAEYDVALDKLQSAVDSGGDA